MARIGEGLMPAAAEPHGAPTAHQPAARERRPGWWHDHHAAHDAADSDATLDPGNPDELQLTTVGVDIGSSTSHLMVSRLTMRRLGKSMYSKWVVVDRSVLFRSPVLLTPYRSDFSIDADELQRFVSRSLAGAGISNAAIDTGAVVLTGEAVRRRNARAIAELFAENTGKFVCASAGHNLEATVAAYGSGAVEMSHAGAVLNIDIGGGTSKLAYAKGGRLVETLAINVGGRLVAVSPAGRIERIEPAAHAVADDLGVTLRLGSFLEPAVAEALAVRLAECLAEMVGDPPYSRLTERLLLTPEWRETPRPKRVTLSGGVAEYLRDPSTPDFGDIARLLAHHAAERLRNALGVRVDPAAEQLRATVIGLSQFTVQVSGDTVVVPADDVLPFRNVPVARVHLDDDVDPEVVRRAVHDALTRRGTAPGDPVALALEWAGRPHYAALRAIADGVHAALATRVTKGIPLIVCVSQDCALGLGRLLERNVAGECPVVCLDGLDVDDFDFIDVGRRMPSRPVVPVVVKSLVFPVVDPAGTDLYASSTDDASEGCPA